MDDKAPPSAGVSRTSQPRTSLASLPAVDRLMRSPDLAETLRAFGRDAVKRAVQDELASARRATTANGARPPSESVLARRAAARVRERFAPRIRPVVNLTGTVIHTNLGRAPLAEEAIESAVAAMRSYGALEYDLPNGTRGDRDAIVEDLLIDLTGAEAATVVNNNAAAVLLSLAALAARREVVIPHGELIEIGGSFRLPDIMRAAGCKLVAIGTTNRTHPRDYEQAITPRTGLVVKAHWSNYAITGFTKVVDEATIASIAHASGVPFMVDLGAGALVDLSAYGLPREPMPRDSLVAGADVVTFSGDKLLGGPQAGIIVGTRASVARIRKHPLKRALRCSKLTLAALEATLRVYASGHRLPERLPVLALLTRGAADIRAACERLRPALQAFAGDAFEVSVVDCASQIGSGSLPVDRLPSCALAISPRERKRGGGALDALAKRLRTLPLAVIGRIHDGMLLLDLRCLLPADEPMLTAQLREAPA